MGPDDLTVIRIINVSSNVRLAKMLFTYTLDANENDSLTVQMQNSFVNELSS